MQIKVAPEGQAKEFTKFFYGLLFTREKRFAGLLGFALSVFIVILAIVQPENQRLKIPAIIVPIMTVASQFIFLYAFKSLYNRKYPNDTTFEFSGDKLNIKASDRNSTIDWLTGNYSIKEYTNWVMINKQSEKAPVMEEVIPKSAFNEGQLVQLRSDLAKWFK